jgi:hypothetical protein
VRRPRIHPPGRTEYGVRTRMREPAAQARLWLWTTTH